MIALLLSHSPAIKCGQVSFGKLYVQDLRYDIYIYIYIYIYMINVLSMLYSALHDFVGNHSFLLWGRLMMGSHPHYLLLSFSMISVTWLIYYLVVAPFLHSEFFYLAGIALWTSNIVFLFLTAFVEPGIQPRRQQSGRHSSFSYLTSNENSEVAADSLSLEGSVLKQNYCKICSIVRNERTKHCRYCNVCGESRSN